MTDEIVSPAVPCEECMSFFLRDLVLLTLSPFIAVTTLILDFIFRTVEAGNLY